MWTLRDIWHFFDEEERKRWLQEQAQKKKLWQPQNLRDVLSLKHGMINSNPEIKYEMDDRYMPLEDYYNLSKEGYDRLKNPPKYKGML